MERNKGEISMGYKCGDCGNDKEFEANACDHMRVVIDANGDYIGKVVGSHGNLQICTEDGVICGKCESGNVAWVVPKQASPEALQPSQEFVAFEGR